MNIKYRPIKAFLLAVEAGSFTKAASRFGVTQPSFTSLIQDLEETLGLRLFERSTRSIQLTSAGVDFLARIQRPVTDMEEAYQSILDLSAARRGTVIVGALPSAAYALVPPALSSLRAAHAALKAKVIEAHNDELLLMLRTNQIECAVATLLEPAPDLVFETIIEDCFCAVHPHEHALSALPSVTWKQLPEQGLILLAKGSSARAQYDRALEKRASLSLEPDYDVTNMLTAVSLMKLNCGVTVLPRLALPHLGLEGMVCRPIRSPGARRTIGLVRRRDRQLSPAIERFKTHLLQIVPEVEAGLIPLSPVRGRSSNASG